MGGKFTQVLPTTRNLPHAELFLTSLSIILDQLSLKKIPLKGPFNIMNLDLTPVSSNCAACLHFTKFFKILLLSLTLIMFYVIGVINKRGPCHNLRQGIRLYSGLFVRRTDNGREFIFVGLYQSLNLSHMCSLTRSYN